MIWVVLLLGFFGEARWAEVSEADAAVNFERIQYKVRKDGSYTIEVEYQSEILKESARQRVGLTRLNYPSQASKVNLLEAYTINGDKRIKVRSEHIEIKPLASSGPGFDEVSQVTIAFPDVQVGSKLYYRYRRDVLKPQIPGVFWASFPIGWNEYIQSLSMKVDSEIPLHIELFDPDSKLALVKTSDRQFSVSLKEPSFRMVVEEENIKMNARAVAWFGMSSIKVWSEFPAQTRAAYEKVISSALPAKYRPIVDAAAKESSSVGQINAVTSRLADTVRYVGDWVPVEGAYHPRPLDVVVETGFGDCKDFSSSTAAMLRLLGFEAHAAWVVRDRNFVQTPISLPGPYFNHAIVWARKDGKEFWIDPTNPQSYAQGLFDDIEGRPAVVLTAERTEPKMIPPASEKNSQTRLDMTVQFGKGQTVEAKGRIQITGGDIVAMTGAGLSFSKSAMDFSFLTWIANPAMLSKWQFGSYDLSSRIVQDFATDFQFTENWSVVPTSAGRGYLVKPPAHLDSFIFRNEKRVSDIHLGAPRSMRRVYKFKGVQAQLKGPRVRCQGDSEWLQFSREFRRQGRDVLLDESVILKKSSVSITEIRSSAFQKIQAAIRQCQQASILVLN